MADVLETDQPKVSALMRGRLAGFSLDRLVRFLERRGSDVEIVVKTRTRTPERARVLPEPSRRSGFNTAAGVRQRARRHSNARIHGNVGNVDSVSYRF